MKPQLLIFNEACAQCETKKERKLYGKHAVASFMKKHIKNDRKLWMTEIYFIGGSAEHQHRTKKALQEMVISSFACTFNLHNKEGHKESRTLGFKALILLILYNKRSDLTVFHPHLILY